MMGSHEGQRPTGGAAQEAGRDSTLLPMLVGGLVLVVVGAVVIMMFV